MEKAESKPKKKKKWLLFRHRVVTSIVRYILGPYSRLVYGIRVEKFREQGDRNYLILMNHQTAFDQFFVGLAFKRPIYYVASEDLFSNGFTSSLIRWLVNPIPIKKQTSDAGAVMNCLRVAREGGTIAIAPEGNRTYSGRMVHIKPAIVRMARLLKLPIAIFRIEGGYGVHPRWSDVVRKGRMRGHVSRVIEPEEVKALSDEALFDLILKELSVDEACAGGPYRHKKQAEFLERAMYVCPHCGFSTFESHNDLISCQSCGMTLRHLPTRELEAVKGDFPFRFVGDWYDYQCDFVRKQDWRQWTEQPLYTEQAELWEVILYKNKRRLQKQITLRLYGDRYEIQGPEGEPLVMPFEQVNVATVLGRNKLNIYFGDKVYQIRGHKRFNALKYVNLCYHYKNQKEETGDGEFLGL